MCLTDRDILLGLCANYDSHLAEKLTITRPDLLRLSHDSTLRKMAQHVVNCEFDRTLAQLTWADDPDSQLPTVRFFSQS